MRNSMLTLTLVGLMAVSCDTTVVEDTKNEGIDRIEVSSYTSNSVIDSPKEVINEIKLENGIRIKWFEHGEGDKLMQGDCVSIDYKVALEDNVIVDGNHLLKKESLPFLLGFNMQTTGWEIALKELRVGDFAEVFIPSKLARGEKGIDGLIPPNADNILRIRILEKIKPSREVDGNKVWVFEENESNTVHFKEGYEINFHCMVSTPSNPLYVNTYRANKPIKMSLGDGGLVPGLKKALINAKKSDRMFVYVPSSEAYGKKGYQDVVMANEDLFYNILVMDVVKK
ncbi:MAG: FKBP-type peptidyl-prolyl cis-trans isomerase [Crocinitomicaceae bacterium]|nr:FKBP-type peptidyl-prolyl cis-trans isomerase [Crocinitomicaceae bacterium]